jgi:hypothetical protein
MHSDEVCFDAAVWCSTMFFIRLFMQYWCLISAVGHLYGNLHMYCASPVGAAGVGCG